jgi:DNA helicase-2/ATP-dependent DNA helicase PcrA
VRYRDIAVLYRSVRTSAPPLIEALRELRIPFSCAGRTGVFLQPEIALFGELFAWFVDGEWKDDRFGEPRPADLDHIVAGLERQFGDGAAIPGLRKYLEDWRMWQLRGTRPVSLVGDFYKLLAILGADRLDCDSLQGAARLGALARFSLVLADFEHVNRRGRFVEEVGRRAFRAGQDRGKPYFRNLHNYLLHYARDAYEDYAGEPTADLDAVDILTVHQAKGLEWPVVFLPGLVDGRFPSRLSGRPQEWLLSDDVFPARTRARYEGSEAEDRRLFYVALTRARDCAYLSCFERKTNRFKPSPFLLEVAGDAPPRASLPLPEALADGTLDKARPLEVSFSDLALFEECGHRYRLANVLGFQQELAVELGYGKTIHHVLRQVAEATRATGAIPQGPDLAATIDREFYLPFADAPAFDRMHRSAERLVQRYLDEYSDDLRRVWAVDRPFELRVEGGVVTGRADLVLGEEGNGNAGLAIVDYKLANDPVREERYRRQLAVYTAAARSEGLPVDAAYLHELKDGTRRPVDVTDPVVQTAVTEAGKAVAAVRRGDYPPRPDRDRCRGCDYRRLCGPAHHAGIPRD